MMKFEATWKSAAKYAVTLTGAAAGQSSKSKSGFLAVCVQDPAHQPPVPFTMNLLGLKARSVEKIRLRCLNSKCSLRSSEELMTLQANMCSGQQTEVNSEIQPDDAEEQDDNQFQEEEGDLDMAAAGDARDYIKECTCEVLGGCL